MEKMKLKVLFRIPFTLYFLAIAEMRDYAKFKKKRFLCFAIKEFMDGGSYRFSEVSRHNHIDKHYL